MIEGELTTPTLGLKTLWRGEAFKKADFVELSALGAAEEDDGVVFISESTLVCW